MSRRIAGVLGLLLGLFLAGGLGSVAAAQTAGIAVQIVNGTPGGGAVAGLPLTVYEIDGKQQQVVAQNKADTHGAFAWPSLSGAVSARYVVSTTYQGVAYRTDQLALPASSASLRVYETTQDDKPIRIANAGVVVLGADAATQRISVLETVMLRNSGTRTFLPGTTGPRGPMGLLRFGLPDGAGNLAPDSRLSGATIIQVNTGFATDLPLPPGDTEVAYSYDLAYGAVEESGYTALNRTMPYAVDLFRVLVPQGPYTASSPQLTDAGTATVGSHTYRLFQTKNLPPQSEVTMELRDLPLIEPVLRSSNPWLQLLLGILLICAVGFPLGYRSWYLRRAARSSSVLESRS
ncbi:MAG: hypothetical protein ACR2M0_01295 [Chloroflexia bacterium]